MNTSEQASVRESLSIFLEQLHSTTDDIRELTPLFADDRFVTDKTIKKYISSLQKYQARAKEIGQYLENQGKSFTRVSDIEKYIRNSGRSTEEQERFLQLTASPFLCLSSKNEKAMKAIEAAKNTLKKWMEDPSGQDEIDTKPYSIVVNSLQNSGQVSYDELEIIQKAFGTIFMVAFDRGDLFIEEMNKDEKPADQENEILPEYEQPAEDEKEQIPETNQEEITAQELSHEDEETTEQYVFSIEKNIPASTLTLIDLKKMVDKKPDIPVTLNWFAREKLYHAKQEPDSDRLYFVPNPGTIQYLLNHGFLAKLKTGKPDNVKEYLVLSSKGIAVFTKESTRKYMEQQIPHEPYQADALTTESDLIPVNKWNRHYALQASLMHDMLSERKMNYVLTLFSDDDSTHLAAITISDGPRLLFAAINTSETTKSEMDLYRLIGHNADSMKTTFIVDSKQEIAELIEQIHPLPGVAAQMTFSISDENFRAYYSDGTPAE